MNNTVISTATDRAHNLLAFGAFASASVGGLMVGVAFGATTGLEALAPAATAPGWGMTAASARGSLSPRSPSSCAETACPAFARW